MDFSPWIQKQPIELSNFAEAIWDFERSKQLEARYSDLSTKEARCAFNYQKDMEVRAIYFQLKEAVEEEKLKAISTRKQTSSTRGLGIRIPAKTYFEHKIYIQDYCEYCQNEGLTPPKFCEQQNDQEKLHGNKLRNEIARAEAKGKLMMLLHLQGETFEENGEVSLKKVFNYVEENRTVFGAYSKEWYRQILNELKPPK